MKKNTLRSRCASIDAFGHRTGVQSTCRFIPEEGLIINSREGTICAE